MQTVTEFIIDLSGSMKYKIALTKQMLISDIIPNLDYSSRIGIKSFSAVTGHSPVIQELPLNIIDRPSILKVISDLQVKENGGTPISEAIRQSVLTLKEYSANNKKIILVTDGQEDQGGDYVNECKKAKTEGINCEIHIVGIGLNQKAQAQAQEISRLTNGSFSHIPFSQGTLYNQAIVKDRLLPFYNSVKNTIPNHPDTVIASAIPPLGVQLSEVIADERRRDEDNTVKIKNESKDTSLDVLQSETKLILEGLVKDIREIRDEIKKLKTDVVPDIQEDEELNERVRSISEEYLFEILKVKYPNRVKWLNEKGESGINHDFEILEEDGSIEYYIECKGTPQKKTTFYITKNEWNLFLNNTKNYQVYFVQNTFGSPTHIFINNLLDWLLKGKVYPYLKMRDIVKEDRVLLTISDSNFVT